MKKEFPQAIVLAAGKSSRLQKFKPLLPLGNKAIIEHTVSSLYNVCKNVFVVCGYRHVDISEVLSGFEKIKLILNNDFQSGMFSSVIEGVKNVSSERFFIIPADMPFVKESTYKELLEVDSEIVIPSFNGKKGHPVLFNKKLIPELLTGRNVLSLKEFITKKTFAIKEVNDNGILFDIDTKENYDFALKYFEDLKTK
jgi:molybdenum cofactor cytidylyltransferase